MSNSNPWVQNAKSVSEITDFANMLRQPVVVATMFVGNGNPYTVREYAYLTDPKRRERYEWLLPMTTFGNPDRSDLDGRTTGNAIHQVCHIATFEDVTGTRLDAVRSVYEFGGGFGNMAEIFRHYANPRYVIQDLPECLALQKVYLGATVGTDGTEFVEKPVGGVYGLFISTWALSEVDLPVREAVRPIILQADKVLIAYAATFHGVDNKAWFGQLEADMKPTHDTYHLQIPAMDGNHTYYFAVKR